MNVKYVLEVITVAGIIGGTIYAIKKSRDAKKAEEDVITLDDAKKIVEDNKALVNTPEVEVEMLMEYVKADAEASLELYRDIRKAKRDERNKQIRVIKASDIEDLEEEEEDDIDETIEGPTIDETIESAVAYAKPTEEEDELRYEPNSREARHQYIRMELAEWAPLEDTYETFLKLFEFPFHPQSDGDEMLRTQIIDFKAQFFGHASKWTQEVSYADIILHYSRAAEFNCGESVRYWVEYFLEFNELDFTQSSAQLDDVIEQLNSHTYFNEERQTFGLFGLSRSSMDQAIRIANRNIDRSVTYEIEFNEFLKTTV